MTDNTQELDDILFDLCDLSYASFTTQEEADMVADQLDYDRAKAKQAITSLIKELVAEAKPSKKHVGDEVAENRSYTGERLFNATIDEYHSNLLKALEEK